MKQLITICLLFIAISGHLNAQTSCCNLKSNAQFASLGKVKEFQNAHAAPLPYSHVGIGKKITFPVSNGKEGHAYEIKSKNQSNKFLIVVHEWWGLNDYILKESDKLFGDLNDVNILAIDLYDGKIATTKEEAGKYMGEVDAVRAKAIIEGAIRHAGSSAKIASIGWCFGGGWSLQTALIAGKRAVGCVMYYGMPEQNVDRLKTLNTDVLGIFAKKDGWINEEMIGAFQKNMEEAGKDLTVHWFDADHAFANPSNPNFDKKATEESHKLAVSYLAKSFKK
ncbi:MAG TPA: dienelactone hydrolase family protein [Cytophagaceae bacterium]